MKIEVRPLPLPGANVMLTYEFTTSPIFVSVIEDDHLLNATYYSPDIEEPLDSTAMLGNIVHSESPPPFQAGGGGGGGGTTFNGGSLHHSHSHHHGGSQSHIDTAASVGKSKCITIEYSSPHTMFFHEKTTAMPNQLQNDTSNTECVSQDLVPSDPQQPSQH